MGVPGRLLFGAVLDRFNNEVGADRFELIRITLRPNNEMSRTLEGIRLNVLRAARLLKQR